MGSTAADRGYCGGLGGGCWRYLVAHYELKCAQCQGTLPAPKRPGLLGEGRPREYCRPACVQRAFRKRRKALMQWLAQLADTNE